MPLAHRSRCPSAVDFPGAFVSYDSMSERKFKVGQAAEYHPPRGLYAPAGGYHVTAELPMRYGEFAYCIKHPRENHDRVAAESDLSELWNCTSRGVPAIFDGQIFAVGIARIAQTLQDRAHHRAVAAADALTRKPTRAPSGTTAVLSPPVARPRLRRKPTL